VCVCVCVCVCACGASERASERQGTPDSAKESARERDNACERENVFERERERDARTYVRASVRACSCRMHARTRCARACRRIYQSIVAGSMHSVRVLAPAQWRARGSGEGTKRHRGPSKRREAQCSCKLRCEQAAERGSLVRNTCVHQCMHAPTHPCIDPSTQRRAQTTHTHKSGSQCAPLHGARPHDAWGCPTLCSLISSLILTPIPQSLPKPPLTLLYLHCL